VSAPTLHLLLGPTGSAKTARAVELAAALDAPVVVMDRVQVFDDLATISGRPAASELRGTRRLYLDHRRVLRTPVELHARAGMTRLERLAARLGPTVIVEGGSLSLWRTFLPRLDERQARAVHACVRVVEDWDRHAHVLRERCIAMMRTSRPSMLDELAAALAQPRARSLVRTLIGVERALGWCAARGVPPEALPAHGEDEQVVRGIADAMLPALVDHARVQQATFRRLLADRAHEVEVVR
jgi:adenylate dimethylallyltransferase